MTSVGTSEKGTYATAEEFLDDRRDWLELYTIESRPGSYDVVLKLDGGYSAREEAEAVADTFTTDIEYLLRNTSGTASPLCPMCAQPSVLVPELDRYVHVNGSSNEACWRTSLRLDAITPRPGGAA